MDQLEFRIENVGGCRRATVTLAPGVVVLTGPNGAGKTSAIRAIARATGADVPLEPRDGSPGGVVEGPGVSLRVRKSVTTNGTSAAGAADVGPLADLIDPGLKDPDAAARARLRALLRLVPLPPGRDALHELAAGDQQVEHAALGGDRALETVLDVAQAVLLAAQKLAREAETRATAASGEAAALQAAIAAKGVTAEEAAAPGYTPEEARAIVQDAARELDVAREGHRRRREAEARLAAARTAGGQRPDVESARAGAASAAAAVDAAEALLATLREQVAAQEEQLRGLRQRHQERTEELGAYEEALRRWDAQQALLAAPVEGPTAEVVAAAEALYNEVAGELALAEKRAEVRQLALRHDEAAGARDSATGRAVHLRDLAKGVNKRLAGLLSSAGLEGIAVVDGRLVVDVGGEQRDFAERLSDGERISAALRVAAVAYPGRVVPLDGRFWTALDPARQAAFAAEAERRGLFVLTEAPGEGDCIHSRHLGAAVLEIA